MARQVAGAGMRRQTCPADAASGRRPRGPAGVAECAFAMASPPAFA